MSIPRRALFGKLNMPLFKAMESAASFAKLKDHGRVQLSHWLLHFWQLTDTDLHLLARHHRVDLAQVQTELATTVQSLPQDQRGVIDFSPVIEEVIQQAWLLASLRHHDTRIRSAWLLEALRSQVELRAALQAASSSLARLPLPLDDEDWRLILKNSVEQQERAYDQTDLKPAVPGEASDALTPDGESRSALAKYCTDLTLVARQGGIDPVIGREHEIRTMMDILLRRRQNNPLLTGEAGMGKTAMVEGLALAIAQQTVPPALQHVRLLSLDVGALIAGASMRGEFESRLKHLLHEAQASEQPILLFIDEIHTLVGAGGQAGIGDAANLLKPALARGGLRTIGATTWREFKRHIEKDPALTRRFQVLQVLEPEELDAMAMVRGLVGTFAEHHQVTILDEAVQAAVTLSHRYIPARQLPDKAISLLDTACARVAMSLHAPPSELVACQSAMRNLQTQLDLVQQQADHPQPDTVQDLQAQLDTLAQQALTLQARWTHAKELVTRLQQAWQATREEGADPTASQAHARHLQQALAEVQAEAPQVHALVDAAVVAQGLLQGLSALQQICEHFADSVHPQLTIDGELDPIVRANTLAALCDPQGLLDDVREVVVASGSAQRLRVRDVERALSVPRPPYAPEPDAVQRQLADLYQRRDANLLALQACAACVQFLQTWSRQHLVDDAPVLAPLLKLLTPFLGSTAAVLPVPVERVDAEPVPLSLQPIAPAALDVQVVAPSNGPLHALDASTQREQVRQSLAQVRQWIEHHEPSSPVAVLLKQAERMWGKRFAEVAHLIPAELLRAWDQDH
jgi:type VI secretion system protein VasG